MPFDCVANCMPFHNQNISCMLPDILNDYETVFQRYRQLAPKRKRLLRLAKPKSVVSIPSPECECKQFHKPKVEIIRLDDQLRQTRTEQLSYPYARKLIDFKNQKSFSSLYENQKQNINSLLHKSLTSLYSHLSNVLPPRPPKKFKKWSLKEKKNHEAYINRLAAPKHINKQRKKKKTKQAYWLGGKEDISPRLKRLARSKSRKDPPVREWKLTKAMKQFEPSARLMKLARSKGVFLENFDPFKVNPKALLFKTTNRLNELAEPQAYRMAIKLKDKLVFDPFEVSAAAMRAQPSERLNMLAQPKMFLDFHTRKNPYRVPPNALRARATPRLLQLAQPKMFK